MLSRRSQVHSKYAPYSTEYILKYTPGHAPKDAPNCTRWHTPSLLDCALWSKLSRRSQAHSKYAPKYTPGHALKKAPNCTRWYTPCLLGSTLPFSLDYMLPCTLRHARSRDLLSCRRQAPAGVSCRRQAPGGVRQVAYGGSVWRAACGVWCVADGGRRMPEIMMLVEIIVWTLSLARPPRQDLTMPHGHGVDNCSLRFRRKNLRVFHRPKDSGGKLHSSRGGSLKQTLKQALQQALKQALKQAMQQASKKAIKQASK